MLTALGALSGHCVPLVLYQAMTYRWDGQALDCRTSRGGVGAFRLSESYKKGAVGDIISGPKPFPERGGGDDAEGLFVESRTSASTTQTTQKK
jgi:hypothetical protein